jgi:modulator of FtsH protease HflC
MGPRTIALGIIGFAGLLVASNTLYTVSQTEQVLVLELGVVREEINEPGWIEPGLKAKVPFVQSLVRYERRPMTYNLQPIAIVAQDQERLTVDAYTRWRIQKPLVFYQNLGTDMATAENRLQAVVSASVRRVLGSVPSNDIISGRRGELMQQILSQVNAQAAPLGISVQDVRIRQADLPAETVERVFERMRTDRQRIATEVRATGAADAQRIRAEGRQEAETIRGAGDAEATRLYADAFGKDPEFAAFYRSMQSYETSFGDGTTTIVVTPQGDYFRYMENRGGN